MRRNKYGVSPKDARTYRGIVFHSKKEMDRYTELEVMEKVGEILDLRLQPSFDLIVNGVKVGRYVADFWYETPSGEAVVEDVKGVRTPVYRLKKKITEALYGFEITEI